MDPEIGDMAFKSESEVQNREPCTVGFTSIDNNESCVDASFNLTNGLPTVSSLCVDSALEDTVREDFLRNLYTNGTSDESTGSVSHDILKVKAAPKSGFFHSGNKVAQNSLQQKENRITFSAKQVRKLPAKCGAKALVAPQGWGVCSGPKVRGGANHNSIAVIGNNIDAEADSAFPTMSDNIGELLEDGNVTFAGELDGSDNENYRYDTRDDSDDLSVSDDDGESPETPRLSKAARGTKRKLNSAEQRKDTSAGRLKSASKGKSIPEEYKRKTRSERRRIILQYYVGAGERDISATVRHFRESNWPWRTVKRFLDRFKETGTVEPERKRRADAHDYNEIGDKLLKLFIERGDQYSGKEAMVELNINKNAYWRVCDKHEGFKKALAERNLESELGNEAKRSIVIEKFLAADGDYRERRNACVRYFWKTPGYYQTFIFETVDRFIRSGSVRSNDRTKQSTWSSNDAHGALLRLVPAEERYMLKLQAAQAEVKSMLINKTSVTRKKKIAGIDQSCDKDLLERNAQLEKLLAKSETEKLDVAEQCATLRAELNHWKLWAASTAIGQPTSPPAALVQQQLPADNR